jgi:hypothetical protein
VDAAQVQGVAVYSVIRVLAGSEFGW